MAVEREQGTVGATAPAPEILLAMYRRMVLIRRFEETMVDLYAAGLIPGFVHSSAGEEAVHVGASFALGPQDYITGTHRGHGMVLARGVATDRVMAELMGKSTGTNRGKGGSMHIADFSAGVLPVSGIVAGGVPMATGAAWSAQFRRSGQVSLALFGDGSTNRGAFHEAVNMGGAWKLPVVYVCIDNGWGISHPRSKATAARSLVDRAIGYGIPGVEVDGKDVLAVHAAAVEAVAHAREGGGPTLIVADCPRPVGHEEGDPQTYRAKEDIERALQRDPIPAFRNHLLTRGVLDGESTARIDREVEAEIAHAVSFGKESPLPDPREAIEDIFEKA